MTAKGRRIFISYQHLDRMRAKGFNLMRYNKHLELDFVGRHLLDPVDSTNRDYITRTIKDQLAGTSVTVAMWGTKRFDIEARQGPRTRVTTAETRYLDRPDCQPGNGGEGFDIVVTRLFLQGGAEVRRQEFETRYLAQPPFVCGPPPGA